jgi:nitrite reductase/ring-hydroxylating ferredoxin subunit/uncharacterized membrane protein
MRLSRFTERLEAASVVDLVGQPVNQAAHRVIPSGRMKDGLSGTWLGHPLHPVLVMVPIGSWTSASLIDLTLGGRSSPAARRLVGLGVLSALPSVLSGLADWSDTAGAEQRVGLTHATLNSVAVALYAASWWARRRRGPAGTVLALAGMAVATGAGYLGGHLIYSQGVGVDTNSFHSGPGDWLPVSAVEDIPADGGRAVAAGRTRVLLFRRGSQVGAVENRCSHRGGPLVEGMLGPDCVTCPWHGSRFDLERGEVLSGPATVAQPVYETRVTAGQVEVRRHEERALRVRADGPG